MRLVVTPVSEGYSVPEIAKEIGTTRRWASEALGELQDELRRLG